MGNGIERLIALSKEEKVHVFRNRKIKKSLSELYGGMGIQIRIRADVQCKIYFGNGIDVEMIKKLFEILPDIENLARLELINIPYIPTQIGKLLNLKNLIIQSSYLTELPLDFRYLKNLTELSLRLDNLINLPDWLFTLSNLAELDLFGAGIQEIPKGIEQLKELRVLDLCCTHLKRISPEILELNLPFKDFFNESGTDGIYFCDATCQSPPENILLGGNNRLKIYYNKHEMVEQNEVRVILLGLKGSGKTSLVQRLMEIEEGKHYYNSHKGWTEGISIKNVNSKSGGILHFWDFGGQEIMLSTHTLFLRDHCIYVIVLNARQGDEAERWLDYVSQYGRNSTVFIVNNHMDEADSSLPDINRLRRLYPELVKEESQIWELSCEKPDEYPLNQFYFKLTEEANRFFGKKIPLSWRNLNVMLSDMKKSGRKVNYITHKDYLKKCTDCGIELLEEKIEALNWLNEIGVVFTYGDPQAITSINALKILRPAWVTDAIYKIINYVPFGRENCLISHNNIRQALHEGKSENDTGNYYRDQEILFILDVMRQFGLSFCFNESLEFIPAVAKNEELREVREWEASRDKNTLDAIYQLSQMNCFQFQESNISLTQFYQIIINIVADYHVYPQMWRSGALFTDIHSLKILMFLQDRGKWGNELRLIVRGEREEKRHAAEFYQHILMYLKKYATNCRIDELVLLESGLKAHYFSVTTAKKTLLNEKGNMVYDSELDATINLFEDVIKKVVSNADIKVWQAVERLRSEVMAGNQRTDDALVCLNHLLKGMTLLQEKADLYLLQLQKMSENSETWMKQYSNALYHSEELFSKLQEIAENCNLQETEVSAIKDLLESRSEDNIEQETFGDKVKNALNMLATVVTITTADYSKIIGVFDCIYRIMESINK